MSLSPLEIRNQDFGKSPLGYKRDEVKMFLAQVAETVAELIKEREQYARRLESQMKRISELESQASSIGHLKDIAEREAQEIIEQARRQAQHIVANADNEAQKIIDNYSVKINETKQQLYELSVIKDGYFRKLLTLLERNEESLRRFDDEYEARRVNVSIESLAQSSRIDSPLSDNEVFAAARHRRRRSSLFSGE